LEFEHEIILQEASSCAEVIFDLAENASWAINQQGAEHLLGAIMSDTLGFSTQNVTPDTFAIAGELTKLGASTAKIEDARREFMKKAPEILEYKGELIRRIEYFLDGKLALVHIPWDEIKKYSDKYNPSVLVLDEMRLVEGVEVCVAVKTYPDGKLTGKIRTNSPVAGEIAGFFGGGGHEYAAGFRIYDKFENVLPEILTATEKVLN
jgi:phosphoesterase RecJ-like protein